MIKMKKSISLMQMIYPFQITLLRRAFILLTLDSLPTDNLKGVMKIVSQFSHYFSIIHYHLMSQLFH